MIHTVTYTAWNWKFGWN